MEQLFAYRGDERLIEAVAGRVEQGGFARTEDVANADAVITYCLVQSELEELYFGDEGLVQVASPGSLLVDLSASTPTFARELNAVATVSNLAMVEAPLVVSDMAARHAFERENLTCFVSGEDKDVTRAEALLACIFNEVRRAGAPGAAQLARAAHTLQMSAQVVSLMEARALWAASTSVETGVQGKVEVSLHAASEQAESVLRAIEEERFDGDYSAEMLMAELSAALMAADDVDLILPQSEAIMHLLELLAVVGGSEKAPSSLALVYGEETECAKHGLDWGRANEVYGEQCDAHAHEESFASADDRYEDDDADDYDDFGEQDDSYGGFEYSSN